MWDGSTLSLRYPGFFIWGLSSPPGLQSLLVFSVRLVDREGCTQKMFVHRSQNVRITSVSVLLVATLPCCPSNYKDPGNVIAMCQTGTEDEYWQTVAGSDTRSKIKWKFRGLQDKSVL